MNCTCKSDIEAKLLERFRQERPDVNKHEAELKGYGLVIGETLESKGFMPLELTAEFPLKKGGFKRKTEKQSMFFNYCPFCGEKYGKKAA